MEDAQFHMSISRKKNLACTCPRWGVFKLRRLYCVNIIARDLKGRRYLEHCPNPFLIIQVMSQLNDGLVLNAYCVIPENRISFLRVKVSHQSHGLSFSECVWISVGRWSLTEL